MLREEGLPAPSPEESRPGVFAQLSGFLGHTFSMKLMIHSSELMKGKRKTSKTHSVSPVRLRLTQQRNLPASVQRTTLNT